VLINVVGGPDMRMKEIQEAASLIQEQAHEDANIIFGASIDENMADVLKVTVIATGFNSVEEEIPVEIEAERSIEQPRARESVAPSTRVSVPRNHREQVPAYSGRRPQAPALSISASRNEGHLPPVRDRIAFPSSQSSDVDTDWDVPAYQRRQGS
jgi:cell division protein FtsZ